MSTEPTTPNLFEFLDYRAFLRDWFEARKREDKRFTHREFVRLAGFSSSGALLNVIRGTRSLTPESAQAVAEGMGLDLEERDFFRALVTLDQATTDDERNDAWAIISAERRFRSARRLEGEAVRFLSHWSMPAIHQLAARSDFQDSPEWVAANLRPPITIEQAAEALESLQVLGLLVHDDDGRLIPADASVVTPPELRSLASCNYHRQMSMRAYDSVASFPADERHLLGVTVAIPDELLPAVKAELNRLQARLLDLCDSAEAPADRVYQLNLQFIPLSSRRDDAPMIRLVPLVALLTACSPVATDEGVAVGNPCQGMTLRVDTGTSLRSLSGTLPVEQLYAVGCDDSLTPFGVGPVEASVIGATLLDVPLGTVCGIELELSAPAELHGLTHEGGSFSMYLDVPSVRVDSSVGFAADSEDLMLLLGRAGWLTPDSLGIQGDEHLDIDSTHPSHDAFATELADGSELCEDRDGDSQRDLNERVLATGPLLPDPAEAAQP